MTLAQQWRVREEGNYLIIENVSSGKVLEVSGGSANEGANVQQRQFEGSLAQKWVAAKNDDGTVTLYSALGQDLVLNVLNAANRNEANVNVSAADDTNAQKVAFYPVDQKVPSSGKTVPDGLYTIQLNGSLALDVKSAGRPDGTPLQLYAPNATISQVFYLAYDQGAGYYTITAANSGRLLDADKGDVVPGGSVNLWGTSATKKQRLWNISTSDNGTYAIVNAANGYYLAPLSVTSLSGIVTSSSAVSWSIKPVDSNVFTWSAGDMDALASAHASDLAPGTYLLSSLMRERSVVDVNGASKKNGANVQLYSANNTDAQRWRVESAGAGYVRIINVGSGKVLDVASAGTAAGTNVQQYGWNSTRAQKWVPVKQSDGSYVFYSALGRSLVLDVRGASTANKANVQVYTVNGSQAQKFKVISTASRNLRQSRTVADGIYTIASLGKQTTCLDVKSASKVNGAQVQTYAKNGTFAQGFQVVYNKDYGCYFIRAAHSGKALDLCEGDPLSGATVQQWTYSSTNKNQRWLIESCDGGYRIRSASSGLYIDCGNGAGKPVTMAHDSTDSLQRWTLSAFTPSVASGCYTIATLAASNRVLDVKSASASEGATIQTYASNKTFAQKWWISSNGDGTYAIQNVGSGKYVSVNSKGNVVQVTSRTSSSAKWKVGASIGGGYTLTNNGNGKALTYGGGSVKLASLNGSSSQGWKFSGTTMVSDGFYQFSPAHASNMRLDVNGASKTKGANVQIYQSNGTQSQLFWVRSAGNGWYTITACNSVMDLDVKNASTRSGANVQQWTRSSGNKAQRWKFTMGPYGVKVVSACGSNVLDVSGAGKGNKTNVQVYKDNGTAAQGWRLIACSRPGKIGYQNPSKYPQVSSFTVKLPSYCTGTFTYVSPSRIAVDATRTDCVNAFINRAYEYRGTKYIEPYSTAPGGAVDCSGLVLQCLYATGMDMGVYNPYNHRWLPWQTYNSMNWYNNHTFKPVSVSKRQRGDVLYYRGHIAIYLGNNKIIDSWPGQGVSVRSMNSRGTVIGAARPYV